MELDIADDICLIYHKLEDMQVKSNKLAEEASNIRLQVSKEKTEVGDEDSWPTPTSTPPTTDNNQTA
ncbi:unnamed protein product [Trichobilharzia regenti]|nr:unnamed protein product [Trichobilharzia regenti]